MSLDVELAMSIVQLTGVLIPLLLGITRYYLNNQHSDRSRGSDALMTVAVFLLFAPLFISYLQYFIIIERYGNHHLTFAVYFYGVFLVFLIIGIPLTVGRRGDAVIFTILGALFLLAMIP